VIIAAIALIWFLRISKSVTMPLAFALFIIALTWPLQTWLKNYIPKWVAFSLTLMTTLLVLIFFSLAIIYGLDTISENWKPYSNKFEDIYQQTHDWAQKSGLPFPGSNQKERQSVFPISIVKRASSMVIATISWLILVFAFFALGLLEVEQFKYKVKHKLKLGTGEKILASAETVIKNFQRYVLTRTLTSGITGILTGLFAWVIGLDFPFVWGLLSYLLNYIPTLGSMVAITLISLFALLQFSIGIALIVFVVTAGIQLALGNYVDPYLQGKFLSLSPLLMLFSIAFWGWVWGIPGALIGVPMTAGIFIAMDQSERTKWLVLLFAKTKNKSEEHTAR
jgi:predicted PurR-regulated permease PerM